MGATVVPMKEEGGEEEDTGDEETNQDDTYDDGDFGLRPGEEPIEHENPLENEKGIQGCPPYCDGPVDKITPIESEDDNSTSGNTTTTTNDNQTDSDFRPYIITQGRVIYCDTPVGVLLCVDSEDRYEDN